MGSSCQLYSYSSGNFLMEEKDEKYFSHGFKFSALDKSSIHWLNFHSLADRDAIVGLCDNQGIDRLVIEDIFVKIRRPKLEEYEGYLFFSIRSALPSSVKDVLLRQEQISFVLGENYLLSLQEKKSDHFTEVRERLEGKKGKIRDMGADFLLFRMLDAIIDNYFEVLEDIAEFSRILEAAIIRDSTSETLKQVEFQKRKLIELRKIVLPLKEITLQLEKVENPYINTKNQHYFTDLKENCMSIMDDIDSNISVLEGVTNLYYAVQGQKMNEIMKVLTIVSTVFIPLTFIAGIYGMNFINMPELKTENGYFYTMGGMFVLGIILLLYFVNRGWLKKNK